MRNRVCCVLNCKNTSRNSECHFQKFPVAKWKINQRNKWVAAVRRENVDGSPWYPKPNDHICSNHFAGREKSDEEASPSYAPTIFPSIHRNPKVDESVVLNRHKRFMERWMKKQLSSTTTTMNTKSTVIDSSETTLEHPLVTCFQQKSDEACQVDFYSNSSVNSKTFIGNRYVNDGIFDAETQTEMTENTRTIKIASKNKLVNKGCGTPQKLW